MATALGFHVYTLPDGRRQKIRDDGRRGLVVGDEAALWDALQEAAAELAECRETKRLLAVENSDLRASLETRRARR